MGKGLTCETLENIKVAKYVLMVLFVLLLQARPKRVAIQMKALDKYILMVLFVLLLQTRPKRVTIQVKALEEYILMVLFVLILKRVHFLTNKTQM